MGPETEHGDFIHAVKYRAAGESFRESMNRIANALKDDDGHFKALQDILLNQRFLPGGRIQAAMGAPKKVTAMNCFVSGTIADSFVDGDGSIMQRAAEAAQTMRMGGGIGYDFSTLRPRGELIKSLDSHSSGVVSFMKIFDAVCATVASAGHRRGAQMAVLRIDHPDIVDFIHAKQNTTDLTNFNTSIAVTDEFMRAVETGGQHELKFEGRSYGFLDAQTLWESIMRSTYDWAEPGVLFIDEINRMNNLWYCEDIAATNPCAEQALPPFGACLLGSFNLVKYLDGDQFKFMQFMGDIPHVVRAMDNVIDRTIYPLPEQKEEALNKRRMGLGVTGMANCIEAMGHPYGSTDFLYQQEKILRILADGCYIASARLAKEKGSFPLYDSEKYTKGEFIKRLCDRTQTEIKAFGIRNSHLISMAPTGTISQSADNISSGIEPVFEYEQVRDMQTPQGVKTTKLQDWGYRNGIRGRVSKDVTVAQHIQVLATAQHWTDSAVSKTCNVPPNIAWGGFKGVYMAAWKTKCKGITTFNPKGKRMGILRDGAECVIGPDGSKSCE